MNLRELYAPVQPSVSQTNGDVLYRELLPHPKLQNTIYCYWQLKTSRQLTDPFTYRVVSDGCIDIFFELTNPQENFVMGFSRKYVEFPLGNNFNYVGIRFLPTMFPQLFKIDASELSNRYEHLAAILPKMSDFIANQFTGNFSAEKITETFDNYFLQILCQATFDLDNRLYNAIEIILKNYGVLKVETDLNTGISPRQLRRLFKYYIGDTAKTFSNVVRFQNILRAKSSAQSLRKNKLFYGEGYYDQSHFIREFKNFYGLPPPPAKHLASSKIVRRSLL